MKGTALYPQHSTTVFPTDPVAVESVVVTLGFRGREAGMKHLGKVKGKEIKDQVSNQTSNNGITC